MADDMHTCSYHCDRPECIRRQRDELARENATLHKSALGGYEDGWHALRNERDALKAELAKLRARIEAAPVFKCEADIISGRDHDYISAVLKHDEPAFQYPDLDGQRVLLVRMEDGE